MLFVYMELYYGSIRFLLEYYVLRQCKAHHVKGTSSDSTSSSQCLLLLFLLTLTYEISENKKESQVLLDKR